MKPWKEIYNAEGISRLSRSLKRSYPSFRVSSFQKKCLKNLSSLSMKERIAQITEGLKDELPTDFSDAVDILLDGLAPEEEHLHKKWGELSGELSKEEQHHVSGPLLWPYTHFVEIHGLSSFQKSMLALKEMTKRFTSEFALRPFLETYPETYGVLDEWAEDPNRHVRRLASEGTRPFLPWAKHFAAPRRYVEKNLTLLDKLKNDSEDYVRRSVANHLNDLSKIEPARVLSVSEKWARASAPPKDVLARGLRHLLKKKNQRAIHLLETLSRA